MDYQSSSGRIPDDPNIEFCDPSWPDRKCYRCQRFTLTIDAQFLEVHDAVVEDLSANKFGHRLVNCAYLPFEEWPLN